jgi:hypothetical protein
MRTKNGKLSNVQYNRFMKLHEPAYFTLLSIVQGVALAFLATNFPSKICWNAENIRFLTTFIIIVLTWNEYLMGVASLKWIPTLFDALIPFTLCMIEIFLSKRIADPPKWYFGMFLFTLGSTIAFMNMYIQAWRHKAKNKKMLRRLRTWKHVSWILCLSFSPCFFVFWLTERTANDEVLSILSLSISVIFAVRTWFYWRKIVGPKKAFKKRYAFWERIKLS